MLAAEKQFCRHGHDTLVVGRSPIGSCKECNRVRTRKSYLKHRLKKSKQGIERKQLTRYGMTPEEYNELFARQGGVCRICSQPQQERRLSIDHDHKTDKVRGLLCIKCNLVLGMANDNIEILNAAIEYLSPK